MKNIRRVDLMNFTAPDSRYAFPARSSRYLSQIDGFSAPTGKNDLRICTANRATFDLPLPRRFSVGSTENGFIPADKLYGFTHPTNSGNKWLVPFFKVGSRVWFLITAQIPKLALEIGGELLGSIGAPDGTPNQQDRFAYSAQ